MTVIPLKRLGVALGGILSASGIVFVVHFIVEQWGVLIQIDLMMLEKAAVLAGLFLYLMTVLGTGASWIVMVRSTGSRVGMAFALWVFLVSQYGKYVPGNVWHFVSRASLAATGSVHPAHSSYVMVVETMLVTFVGVMLSLVGLLSGLLESDTSSRMLLVAGLLGTALFIWFGPPATLGVARLVAHRQGRLRIPDSIRSPGRAAIVFSAAVFCLNFMLNALILYGLGFILLDHSTASYATVLGIFAISWTAGFVTPGAPGGVGVRDGLLVSFLSTVYGPAGAVQLALIHRILSMVGDTIGFLAGMILRFSRKEDMTA